MTIAFRAMDNFMDKVRRDLTRPHRFAAERVGFISIRAAQGHEHLMLLAQEYYPVADEDYLNDRSVGAMMGQEAIQKALEVALLKPVGMFHVHLHGHRGEPRFSSTDLREQLRFVPDFFKVRPQMPHGAIVLSHDAARGRCWLTRDTIVDITESQIVGARNIIEGRDRGQNGVDVIA